MYTRIIYTQLMFSANCDGKMTMHLIWMERTKLKQRKRAQLIYTLDRYLLSHSTWCRKSPLLYLCFVFHLRMIFFSFKMLFYKQKPKCVKVLINIFEFFSFNKMFLFRRWLLNKDVSLIFTRQRNKDEPVICEQ